eukprot:CAMPEP_0197617262 /NCGR_PEP_ID=MMETSP1326-20131121/60944_1 /TAXON_ID=1155430 /ORGANISM="Genus nov. species nov., Strain RCC2288" /LENGTH=31 /DNA_ID= /DNA_START= /DNA_END= /DNA_ORIENTATION=
MEDGAQDLAQGKHGAAAYGAPGPRRVQPSQV